MEGLLGMRKKLFILFVVFFCFFVFFSSIEAGIFSAGLQSYYAWWDSGMAKMAANALEAQLKRDMDQAIINIGNVTGYGDLEVGDPEGRGLIYGPVIGYQTDDKKWDFQLALMWFGSYTTHVDASVSVTGTGTFPFVGPSVTATLPYNTDLTIEHRDIDFQAGYMVTGLFRLFAGYKYQSYETGISAEYNFNYFGQNFYASHDFTFLSQMHMPYLGGGAIINISGWIDARASIGLGLIVAGSMEQDNQIRGNIAGTFIDASYDFDGGKVEMAYCLMGSIALTMKFAGSVNVEFGYQFQLYTFKVKDMDLDADGQADDSGSETDLFHGFTVRAVYLVNM